jgi:hypothetical protein
MARTGQILPHTIPRAPVEKRKQSASWPVSRVLCRRLSPPRWPFIWDACRQAPLATNPDGDAETHSENTVARASVPSLFGFAPGGVYHAAPVASRAVRSYRTLSPLLSKWAYRALRYLRPSGPPCAAQGSGKRFAFCGTFPGVAPAGHYPAPCFRGARTFLHSRRTSTANGHSARLKQRPSSQLTSGIMLFLDRTSIAG